jgi:hypothetical protein
VPAGISVASLTKTEIETLTPLLIARRRKRAVPVEAARAIEAVVIALVEEPETIVVIAPVQAPSAPSAAQRQALPTPAPDERA